MINPRLVSCPFCHAPVGRPCTYVSRATGKRHTIITHSAREKLAQKQHGIMSMDEIIALLQKQAELRAPENDERSLLNDAAQNLLEEMVAL
jgi:RNA polymerase-interacting CarD/CdnL/TRCF family regulator